MKLKFKNKSVTLKQTVRAFMLYENITEKTFNPQNVTDIITFFYCILVCSAKDYTITMEEFLDYLDNHFEVLNEFNVWLTETNTQQDALKKN